jgi:hypothetical protein
MVAREINLESACRRHAESLGGRLIKITPHKRGDPDRLLLLPESRSGFVEFKRPGESVSDAQDRRHREFREMGFSVYIVGSVKYFKLLCECA